jgi:hypothetical protein
VTTNSRIKIVEGQLIAYGVFHFMDGDGHHDAAVFRRAAKPSVKVEVKATSDPTTARSSSPTTLTPRLTRATSAERVAFGPHARWGRADFFFTVRHLGPALQLAEEIWAVHTFQKKSTQGIKTPPREIDLIKNRLKRLKEMLR